MHRSWLRSMLQLLRHPCRKAFRTSRKTAPYLGVSIHVMEASFRHKGMYHHAQSGKLIPAMLYVRARPASPQHVRM